MAMREPGAEGVKAMVTVQPFGEVYEDAVQLLISVKSEAFWLLSATEEMVSGEVPELVMVTFCGGDFWPMTGEVKDSAAAESVAAGRGTGAPVPVPLSRTVWVEPGASSAMMIEALRAPAPSGVKAMVMEQDALGG